MFKTMRKRETGRIAAALLLCTTMLAPTLAGCGRGSEEAATGTASSPVRQSTPNYGTVPAPTNANRNNQQQQGMSTGKKLAILAGAAALLYLYNKNKNKKGTGENGQYYRSKNGRIYYRDAKGNAVYVTPPSQGIQVPAEVAEQYNRAAQSGDMSLLDRIGSDTYSDNNYGTSAGRSGALPPGPRSGF